MTTDHPSPPEAPGLHPAAWRVAAMADLLEEAGVVAPGEIAERMGRIASRSPALGARVVARAWIDEDYRRRLLADAKPAVAELGIDVSDLARLVVLENAATVHHVVVCTLCSCYPRALLGLPPDWYKSDAYRSRIVREPRAVLAEFGLVLGVDVEIRVQDSTADLRYLVLPLRPGGTEGWPEGRLVELVTRESMVGTGLPLPVAD